jgi:hypothetical protein
MTENAPGARPERQCVLVLGMHRSGTSAVARVLSLIGAGLPRHVMAASGSNVAGHWEPKRIVELNERLLLEGDSAWNDWRHFAAESALSPSARKRFRAEIAREIEQEFEGESLFVLKDPRISRITPLYLDALATLNIAVKVVLVSRHPMEVAGSLQARDGMPTSDALLLWLRHDLDAEAATRGADRLVLSYDALMDDPDGAIRRLEDFLKPEARDPSRIDVAAARASLRGELRHHLPRDIACPALPQVAAWASEAFAAFVALEVDPHKEPLERRLDEIRAALDADVSGRGDRIAYVIAIGRRAQAEIQELLRQREVGAVFMRDLEERYEKSVGDYFRQSDEFQTHREERLQLTEDFRQYRRDAISLLATTTRADFRLPDDVPKALSPWRQVRRAKRELIRKRLRDYMTLLASPLFDADFYLQTYPDVAETGILPALHYLLLGSNEGRRPSAIVNPAEVLDWFPELKARGGNLVLGLIDIHAKSSLRA